jgi:SSS family solute:Na+ symporter
MRLTPIDWTIVVVYLACRLISGVWMRRYVRDVEDFAVAGRKMDLNLGVALLAATEVGIVTVMYAGQNGFEHGFAGAIPGVLGCLAMLLVGWTGFVIVPLRKAGVITIPELFEKRFGKDVRWLAGMVVVLGGLLNMGIFLRMGGEFLTAVAGLDPHALFAVPMLGWRLGVLEAVMTALLAIVLLYTALGGMLSVLVTDYLQFLVIGLGIAVTSVLVVWHFGWHGIVTKLDEAHRSEVKLIATSDVAPQDLARYAAARRQAEASGRPVAAAPQPKGAKDVKMKHPFDPGKSFGWSWVVWQGLVQITLMTTWQTTIARVLAARDAATARRLYVRTAFYFVGRFGLPCLWGAAAFLYFANLAAGLPPGADSLNALPQFLGHLMPPVMIGILAAAMLAAEMSTDSGYLLAWATVICNDLINPCLRQGLSPRAKLLIVRILVPAIGLFLVFYGIWCKLPGAAYDYLAVTANIYLASMFTLLAAGLYWPGANRWGAMAAILLGAIGPLSFLVVR